MSQRRFWSRVFTLAALATTAAPSTASLEQPATPAVAAAPEKMRAPLRGLAEVLCPVRDDRRPAGSPEDSVTSVLPRDELWGRPWIESEADGDSDDVNVHMRFEGRPACDGSPRVQYSVHLTVTNRGRRTGWLPTSVCGGQGVCRTPGLDLEVGRGERRAVFRAGRDLYQYLAELRPGESAELDVKLFTCADLGPPAPLRLWYDLRAEARSGVWRSLRDPYADTRAPRGARLLFDHVSGATVVRCLDPDR